jgi:hypothetical protein
MRVEFILIHDPRIAPPTHALAGRIQILSF